MIRTVIVSPHFDDAVFSCGGFLADACQGGKALVLTVFSDSGKTTKIRRQEEARAAQAMGFEVHDLGFCDQCCRERFGGLPHRLFRNFDPDRDWKILDEIVRALRSFLESVQFETILFPLGVGLHIDHLLCFEASQALEIRSDLLFFEEAPYALAPGLVSGRLTMLGQSVPSSPQSRMTPLMDYLTSKPPWSRFPSIARHCLIRPCLKAFLQRRFRQVLSRESSRNHPVLESKYFPMKELFDRKMEAFREYQSQIAQFFNDVDEAMEIFRNYHTGLARLSGTQAGMCERYWSVKQGVRMGA